MKKKKTRSKDIAATTTSWDWGFKPVPNKGGKTTNFGSDEKGGNDSKGE